MRFVRNCAGEIHILITFKAMSKGFKTMLTADIDNVREASRKVFLKHINLLRCQRFIPDTVPMSIEFNVSLKKHFLEVFHHRITVSGIVHCYTTDLKAVSMSK